MCDVMEGEEPTPFTARTNITLLEDDDKYNNINNNNSNNINNVDNSNIDREISSNDINNFILGTNTVNNRSNRHSHDNVNNNNTGPSGQSNCQGRFATFSTTLLCADTTKFVSPDSDVIQKSSGYQDLKLQQQQNASKLSSVNKTYHQSQDNTLGYCVKKNVSTRPKHDAAGSSSWTSVEGTIHLLPKVDENVLVVGEIESDCIGNSLNMTGTRSKENLAETNLPFAKAKLNSKIAKDGTGCVDSMAKTACELSPPQTHKDPSLLLDFRDVNDSTIFPAMDFKQESNVAISSDNQWTLCEQKCHKDIHRCDSEVDKHVCKAHNQAWSRKFLGVSVPPTSKDYYCFLLTIIVLLVIVTACLFVSVIFLRQRLHALENAISNQRVGTQVGDAATGKDCTQVDQGQGQVQGPPDFDLLYFDTDDDDDEDEDDDDVDEANIETIDSSYATDNVKLIRHARKASSGIRKGRNRTRHGKKGKKPKVRKHKIRKHKVKKHKVKKQKVKKPKIKGLGLYNVMFQSLFYRNVVNTTDLLARECKPVRSYGKKTVTACRNLTVMYPNAGDRITFYEMKAKKTQASVIDLNSDGTFRVNVKGLYLLNVNISFADPALTHSVNLFLNNQTMFGCPPGGVRCPEQNDPNTSHFRICNIHGISELHVSDILELRTLTANTEIRLEKPSHFRAFLLNKFV